MRRALFGPALSLATAGILLIAGAFAPIPDEPHQRPRRPATPVEERQYERAHLLDLLRAQQQSGQK